jgi:CSLREA domain-containing protein
MMDFEIPDFAIRMLRNQVRITFALVLALLLGVVLTARPADASSTFTVNSTADPGTGSCDPVECTLREAIAAANTTSGADTINFNIPGSGVKTISPISDLPTITDAVTIDGYTQGDGTADDAMPNTLPTGNDAHLLIELNGSSAGFSSGLKITGANVTVRGLAINRFQAYGLLVDGPDTTIEGNYIGTGASGTTDLGNFQSGVGVFDADNTIGGTTPAARNVISGNGSTLEASGVSFNCNCSTGNRVQGNYIGTDKNGTAPLGNTSDGVTMFVGAHSNTIGGTTEGARNVISGNKGRGVSAGFGGNNQVQGNYIGTDATGTADLGNSSDGVFTSSSSGDTIGGTGSGARNVISGNDGSGVLIRGTGNQLLGNYIGTDKNGTASLGNTSHGVLIDGGLGNWIGGTTEGTRNVISGNGSVFGGSGVFIDGAGGNQVRGNYIGTDKNGTASLGNRFRGVVILDAANNTIGGTDPGAGNVISGNTLSGVFIEGTTAPGNKVQGNYIGTDTNGTAPLGNSSESVNIDSRSGDTIGGTAPGGGNVISSNQGDGVFISGNGSQVQGNYLGIDKNGTRPTGAPDLGNSGAGVDVGSQGANNTIGGTGSGARNVISDNNWSGVLISGTGNQVLGNYVGTDASGIASLGNSLDGVAVSGTNNSILSNSIFANGDLGIDLGTNGVAQNDPQDGDFGANNLQNFPVIESASLNAGGNVTVSGTLNSTPGTTFTVQFFSSPQADPSGFGEGKTFLGEKTDVVTDPISGDATFSFTSANAVPAGQVVSATATDPDGNTSEFSDASTKIVDTIKPKVKRVVPAGDATRVAPGTNVYAFFSEPMKAGSIKGTTFKLYKKGSTTRVSADLTLDPSNSRKAILDPKTIRPHGHLERGVTYKAVVSTGAKDAAGNPLARSKIWFFTVKS